MGALSEFIHRWLPLALSAALLAVCLPRPAAAEVAAVLLDVPWRTQIDGLPDQHHNAGLVSLGIVLAAYGRPAATAELRAEHDRLAGQEHVRVTSATLVNLAAAHGLRTQPARTADDVRHRLEAGLPLLLFLGAGAAPAADRWVVAVGYTDRGEIVYHDPGWPVPHYGKERLLASAEERAWLEQGTPALALILAHPGESSRPRATPAPAPPALQAADSPEWWRQIEVYSSWFGLDPFFVAAVALAESGGNPAAVGDAGHSVGLMQLHDAGVGAGWGDLRYDPLLNLWLGTQALAVGMAKYGDPALAYARHYNPGGFVQAETVMAKYRWLRSLATAASDN